MVVINNCMSFYIKMVFVSQRLGSYQVDNRSLGDTWWFRWWWQSRHCCHSSILRGRLYSQTCPAGLGTSQMDRSEVQRCALDSSDQWYRGRLWAWAPQPGSSIRHCSCLKRKTESYRKLNNYIDLGTVDITCIPMLHSLLLKFIVHNLWIHCLSTCWYIPEVAVRL